MRNRMLSALTALLAAALALGSPRAALASSHSEAPGTVKDRLADDTDFYAWIAADAPDAVTLVGNWVPLLEPNGGPNFYSFDDQAFYYFNIDNDGDCADDVRYEFQFTNTRRTGDTFLYNVNQVTSIDDPDLNVAQTYSVTRIDVASDGTETEIPLGSGFPVAPNFVGPVSMPDYQTLAQQAIVTLPDGTKIFVGPRDDPFFADLAAIFDLISVRRLPGNKGKGVDGLAGYDVLTIAMQVPKTALTKNHQPPSADNSVLGIYSSAERKQTRTLNADGSVDVSGPEMQVSRLGQPLVNEVVIPLKDKDRFNATKPTGDAIFAGYVLDPEVAKLIHLLFGLDVPPAPRNDLVTVFLTGIPNLNQPVGGAGCELLRLNIGVAPAASEDRFGVIAGDVAGFPNGRRLADDVVDVALRVMAGGYVLTPDFNHAPNNLLGDGVDFNDVPFLPSFPYVAPPHNPRDESRHGKGAPAIAIPSVGDRADVKDKVADGLRLMGANPSAATRLSFTVPATAHVTLKMYDVKGRVVATLIDQEAAAGTFNAVWDGFADRGGRASPGVYFARFDDGRRTIERKVILQ